MGNVISHFQIILMFLFYWKSKIYSFTFFVFVSLRDGGEGEIRSFKETRVREPTLR